MNKRHLSDKQKQQIHQQQSKICQPSSRGLVVAHYGDSIALEADDGQLFHCHIRQNLPGIVVGDFVNWSTEGDVSAQTGVVLSLMSRHSEMWRRHQSGKKKLIAANIDRVVIVVAAQPKRAEQLLDRYLVIAQLQKLPAVIIFNKVDLLTVDELAIKKIHYAVYEKMGYSVLFCSNISQHGLEQLANSLQHKTSVVVGLSGVGKSFLIKSLLPEQAIKIGALSTAGGSLLGKHTTTTARLYHLTNGGTIIDSPGIREFAMEGLSQGEIEQGFREFSPYLRHCKFRNCRHLAEPGCAVRQAISTGDISPARWQAYQHILSSCDPLQT